jgi:hypothetical protein
MMSPNLRLLGGLAFLLFAAGTSHATPPTSSPGSSSSTDPTQYQRPLQEFRSLGIDRRLTSFAGTVLDIGDRPVSGVEVKLFVDGEVAGSALTDGAGFYDIRAPYNSSADQTVLLWYVAPERSLMPKEIVVKESRASIAAGLISRCVPRATLSPGRQFRVYLFDPESRNKELAELDCL